MNEMLPFLNEMTPGGVGIWTGVLMFVAYWVKEWRETRKLTSADRQARREGFEAQVTLLMNENRSLRAEMTADRRAHAEYRALCHHETDQLRGEIIRLEDKIAGYKRQSDTDRIFDARLSQVTPDGDTR